VHRFFVAAICLAGALTAPPDALAQDGGDDPTVEQARAEFTAGVELAQAGEYAAAAERFRAALALRPSPAVAFNLAQALAEAGGEPEAWQICDDLVAAEDTPDGVRDAAQQLRDAMQARIGRLRITLGGTDDGTVDVLVDSATLEPERLGRDIAVSAGSHTVESRRAGEAVSTRQIDVPAGGFALVDLSVVATENVRVVEVEREPPPPEDGDTLLWVGIGGGAVLVAAVVVVVVLLASSGPEAPIEGNLPPGVITWE
jgi:hypothetical protein